MSRYPKEMYRHLISVQDRTTPDSMYDGVECGQHRRLLLDVTSSGVTVRPETVLHLRRPATIPWGSVVRKCGMIDSEEYSFLTGVIKENGVGVDPYGIPSIKKGLTDDTSPAQGTGARGGNTSRQAITSGEAQIPPWKAITSGEAQKWNRNKNQGGNNSNNNNNNNNRWNRPSWRTGGAS